jgi:tRNA (mo5U34)-methyltransferase
VSEPNRGHIDPSAVGFDAWLRAQVEREPYWFHKIQLRPDLVTPGWSDPQTDKLPYYGLPEDLTGSRVLDIGCAEGFFSFEAERRGAREVVAIDSFPDSVRRFNLVRAALGSSVTAYLCNVYDLKRATFGTFDYVFFFGVLYHLRHPLLALSTIRDVCVGTVLLQTAIHEEPELADVPFAKFHPSGMKSGPKGELFDPTVFWLPNRACVKALVESAGFVDVDPFCIDDRVSIVVRAQSPEKSASQAPDEAKAPWS